MKQKLIALGLGICLIAGALTGCARQAQAPVEVNVFIAASLSKVMEEIAAAYEAQHPEVTIVLNADSSGTLAAQIKEGATCDIFFSAAQKQVNELESEGLLKDGQRDNVVNNQLVVITQRDSQTKVTGLSDLDLAESIALADGSVPAGKYTRTALIALGILEENEDPATYTTAQISEALGGVEISEQSNVSKVLLAVEQASCEVGTTYYSDTYGYEDEVKILEVVGSELTGDVIYPICRVENDEADAKTEAAADQFYAYVISEETKEIFQAYYFDTDVD